MIVSTQYVTIREKTVFVGTFADYLEAVQSYKDTNLIIPSCHVHWIAQVNSTEINLNALAEAVERLKNFNSLCMAQVIPNSAEAQRDRTQPTAMSPNCIVAWIYPDEKNLDEKISGSLLNKLQKQNENNGINLQVINDQMLVSIVHKSHTHSFSKLDTRTSGAWTREVKRILKEREAKAKSQISVQGDHPLDLD